MIQYTVEYIPEGILSESESLFESAYHEFPENQVRTLKQYIHDTGVLLSMLGRVEILVHDDDKLVGGMAIGIDSFDPHVGQCSYIAHLYVLPEYRTTVVPRELIKRGTVVAKSFGIPYLKTYKRLGDWRYEFRYRRLT